jgi:hypothetical protein
MKTDYEVHECIKEVVANWQDVVRLYFELHQSDESPHEGDESPPLLQTIDRNVSTSPENPVKYLYNYIYKSRDKGL